MPAKEEPFAGAHVLRALVTEKTHRLLSRPVNQAVLAREFEKVCLVDGFEFSKADALFKFRSRKSRSVG
jgi:hypothetical protein